MLSLLWWMNLAMLMLKTVSGDIIPVIKSSGESVLLWCETTGDVRWTHGQHLFNNRTTQCPDGLCELLGNGSLYFKNLQTQHSGNYTLEVFDESGVLKDKKIFHLQVTGSTEAKRSSEMKFFIICSFLFLLLLFITLFVLRKRKLQRSMTSGPTVENIYMPMDGNQTNNAKYMEGSKQEEEPFYVPCNPVRPTDQAEDVYV